MAWSGLEYRGAWFGCNDTSFELWMGLMADEADARADAPAWLRELAAWWREQNEGGGVGCLDMGLDRYVIDEERCRVVLDLAEAARARLLAQGDPLPKDWLNRVTHASDVRYFAGDPDREVFDRDGRRLIALLRGDLPAGEVP